MDQIYTPKQEYKVLCYCITFNQSKYIEDTLNGFAMQKTDFPFACLVVEDCSTDGEQEVIKAWLERECDMTKAEYVDLELSNVILVPHKTNVNCTFAIYLLKRNLWKEPELKGSLVMPWRDHCKYEALCEGDDYWIDTKKLQKQVDFLDSNADYGLVYTGFKILYKDSYIFESNSLQPEGNVFDTLLINPSNFVCTVTSCYRTVLYERIKDYYFQPYFKMGDLPLWLAMAVLSKFKYMADITSVYRKLDSSACHFNEYKKNLEFDKNVQEIKLYFARLNKRKGAKVTLQRRIYKYDSLIALKDRRYIDFIRFFIKGHGISISLLKNYIRHIGQ